jgi:hypothetical protein
LLRRSRSSMYLAVIGWMRLGEAVAPQHADNPARALPSRYRPWLSHAWSICVSTYFVQGWERGTAHTAFPR